MTKTKKIITIALASLVFTAIVLALVAESRISITSRQFISSSRQEVYDQIRFMKHYPAWSPFLVQDPEQKYSISGADGEVGATFHWEGVKEESKGYQTLVALNGIDRLSINCTITVPFQATPSFDYKLIEKNGGVEVVQDFGVDMPFPANVFAMLFGVKAQMAQVNEQGLALLKKTLENRSSQNLQSGTQDLKSATQY